MLRYAAWICPSPTSVNDGGATLLRSFSLMAFGSAGVSPHLTVQTVGLTTDRPENRSAHFQSAVSPISNRQGAGKSQRARTARRPAEYNSAIRQSATLRYELCRPSCGPSSRPPQRRTPERDGQPSTGSWFPCAVEGSWKLSTNLIQPRITRITRIRAFLHPRNPWLKNLFRGSMREVTVAQIFNLLYRRFPIGRAPASPSGLGLGDAPQNTILRYGRVQLCATSFVVHPADQAVIP